MEFVLSVLGVVLVVEGAPWFLSPRGVKNLLRQVHALPDASLRIMGLLLMFLGLGLVWLAGGRSA